MSRTAGFRQVVAAVVFRVCVWRSDAAGSRRDAWERRAEKIRKWGEDA
jgi:hypothetical protein